MTDEGQRQKLFLEVLPKWEKHIKSLSFQTLATKPIPSYLETGDIANRLRLAVWHAVVSWDETRGMTLNSWIFSCIRQGRGLLIEEFYSGIPRTPDGNYISISSMDAELDLDDGEVETQFADPRALDPIEAIAENESFDEAMWQIRATLPNELHKTIFDMILSEEYDSDQKIANALKIDFARVCDVRLRMKIAFAILHNIPISSFTKAQNARRIESELQRKLAPFKNS